MPRLALPLLLLTAVAACEDNPATQPSQPIVVRSEGQDRLHQLDDMNRAIALKRALVQSVIAAGGIAVAALIVTAPNAGASDAKDICNQMKGSFVSSKDDKGNRVESCRVESAGGPVDGSWVNGQWQGTVAPGEDISKPGPGRAYVPVGQTPQ